MEYSERQKEEFNARLKEIIGKKIMTTMMASVSAFETDFGTIWGQGIPESELTDGQRQWRQIWNACRKSIMDTGNRQKRNASTEISMHDVVWRQYNTTFRMVNGNTK